MITSITGSVYQIADLTHRILGKFSCFLSSPDFFQNKLFEKFF